MQMVQFKNIKVPIFIYFHHKYIHVIPLTQQINITSIKNILQWFSLLEYLTDQY